MDLRQAVLIIVCPSFKEINLKVIINKTGELLDLPDKVAYRRIQRGKAHPAPVEEVKADLIFDGIEIKPKAKVIKPKRKKAKVESNPKQEKKLSTSEVSTGRDSGYSRQYSKTLD